MKFFEFGNVNMLVLIVISLLLPALMSSLAQADNSRKAAPSGEASTLETPNLIQQNPVDDTSTQKQGNANPLAVEISRLRAEVEAANSQLQVAREEHRSQISSYASRKGELEALIEKDKIALQQIIEKIKDTQQNQNAFFDQSRELIPEFTATADILKNYIEQSLPYSRDERLDALANLQKQTQGREINVYKAYGRLWSLVEDELRLANEMAMAKQTVVVDGKELLADVARIGSVMLYFKTADSHVGYAMRKEGGGWDFHFFSEQQSKREVEHFFESLKKQIRVGLFELPAPLTL